MLRERIADSLGEYVDRIINDDEPLNCDGCEFDSPTRADIEYTISVRDCGTERHKLDIHEPEERYEFGINRPFSLPHTIYMD